MEPLKILKTFIKIVKFFYLHLSNKLNKILAEISAGELIDKITILEIKKKKISDKIKLLDVEKELKSINKKLEKFINNKYIIN